MSESQDVQTTEDLPLSAFIATYSGVTPFKITTDISEPYFAATYFFKMSSSDFEKAKASYDAGQSVTGIQEFVKCVRKLQALSIKCDRQGGIISL